MFSFFNKKTKTKNKQLLQDFKAEFMMVAIRAETTMMVSNLKKGKKSMRVRKIQIESVSELKSVFIS